jgi:hypothetical protein
MGIAPPSPRGKGFSAMHFLKTSSQKVFSPKLKLFWNPRHSREFSKTTESGEFRPLQADGKPFPRKALLRKVGMQIVEE